MELRGRTGRSILLFTLMLLVVPMVIFPERFGTELARVSLINIFYELVYYGLVVYVLNRRVRLVQLLQAGGACLVYRIAVGAAWGLLIAAIYGLDLRVAVTMGMSSYLPAIILHAVAAPFVLRPALQQIYRAAGAAPRPAYRGGPADGSGSGVASISVSREKGVVSERPAMMSPPRQETGVAATVVDRESAATKQPGEVNGFDRAVRYIGEHSAVHLAGVIDYEGLLLANFRRGDLDPEDWAPLAELLAVSNRNVLDRYGPASPDKIELTIREKRLVIAWAESFSLMVVSERQSDDFLSIRINQAMELISKYFAERYGREAVINTERIHV